MTRSSRLFTLEGLSRREMVLVPVVSLLFLLFQATVVGLIPAQVLMVVLFNLLFFASPASRKLAVAMLPFILFEVTYDWMRLWPNYRVNPIDIQGIYEAEKSLFGITSGDATLIPGEYFNLHHCTPADVLAGIFYLCWVPVPIGFGLWLYFRGQRTMYLHFALAFLLVNWVGFCGYYIHPAAPPWYAINYGFTPDFTTPGNVAGLARFDEWLGVPVFSSIYVNNSNIFAAVPSLHAAYMLVTTIYAAKSRQPRSLVLLFSVITLGIWCTAVYSCHHYIIDVLLGIATAIVTVLLFERLLLRWAPCRNLVTRYAEYIKQ